MHAKYLVIYQSRHWQTIKNIRKGLPKLNCISTFALVVKPINSVDLSTLVVAPQQEEVLRILNFIAEHHADGFNRLLASVDVVS